MESAVRAGACCSAAAGGGRFVPHGTAAAATAQTALPSLAPLLQAGWATGLLGFNVNNIFAKKHGGKKRGPLADDAGERCPASSSAAPLLLGLSSSAQQRRSNVPCCRMHNMTAYCGFYAHRRVAPMKPEALLCSLFAANPRRAESAAGGALETTAERARARDEAVSSMSNYMCCATVCGMQRAGQASAHASRLAKMQPTCRPAPLHQPLSCRDGGGGDRSTAGQRTVTSPQHSSASLSKPMLNTCTGCLPLFILAGADGGEGGPAGQRRQGHGPVPAQAERGWCACCACCAGRFASMRGSWLQTEGDARWPTVSAVLW